MATVPSAAQVKWTVIPAGAEQSGEVLTLRLAVLVSPDLVATAAADADKAVPLASTVFANWPQTLAGLKFQVAFDQNAPQAIRPTGPAADSDLWHRFFEGIEAKLGAPSANLVPTTMADMVNKLEKNTFHYHGVHEDLKDLYSDAAVKSLTRLQSFAASSPPVDTDPIYPPLPTVGALKDIFGPPRSIRHQERAFHRSVEFYDRPDTPNVAAEIPEDPGFDFHEYVSLIAQYPWLQRRLGLLIDFDCHLPAVAIPAGLVSVSVTSGQVGGLAVRTHFTLTLNPPRFAARYSEPDSFPLGCLPLGDITSYNVTQAGVDNIALRASDFVQDLALRSDQDLEEDATAPALHGGALTVSHNNLAGYLISRFNKADKQHAAAISSAHVVELYAEDLIKGFRVDVFFRDRWFSLCKRACTLKLSNHPPQHPASAFTAIPPVLDEGWLTLAPTLQNKDLYLHEAIFSWGGWSLVAPKPGKTLAHDGSVLPPQPLGGRPQIEVKQGPEHFPAQRYGRRFRFRARTVDLAGYSPVIADLPGQVEDAIATKVHPSQRFEPVGAPFVVPLESLSDSPGESATILVIRTADGHRHYTPTARHIAPPPINFLLAEQHGLFDSHGAPDPEKYGRLAEAASPPEFAQNSDWFEARVPFNVQYTQDPLCAGVIFFGLPGTNGRFLVNPGTVRPFLLRLVAGDEAPDWSEHHNVLTVALPRGHTAHVRVASMLAPASLGLLGMWGWMEGLTGGPSVDAATHGMLWPLTPARTLTLIHAVQRPLSDPVPHLDTPNPAVRALGATTVELTGTITLDVPSTGEVELSGSYTEWIDNPDALAPERRSSLSLALPATPVPENLKGPVPFGKEAGTIADIVIQHFPDTRYRRVAYSAIAISRYKKNFATTDAQYTAQTELATRHTPDGLLAGLPDQRAYLDVPNTARPAAPAISFILPLYGWHDPLRDQPGTVKRRMQGGGLRIYLQRGWYSSGDGEQLAVLLWPSETANKWFASQDHNEFPQDLRPVASQWGMDPIWKSKPLTELLNGSHFLNGDAKSARSYTLPAFEAQVNSGNPDARYPEDRLMEIVAFTPVWDDVRHVWFCDIHMDATLAYTPFVRLALARFQPISAEQRDTDGYLIRDVHLSQAVRADFVQLTAGRTVTVVEDRGRHLLSISVTGLTYTAIAAGEAASAFEASLEKHDHHEPLEWRAEPGKTVTLIRSMDPDGSTATWHGSIALDHHLRHGKFRVALRECIALPGPDGKETKRLLYAEGLEL